MAIQTTAVKFNRAGPPDEVVEVTRMEVPDLRPSQVLVRMQAAPINPADLNMLEGRYAVQPELPAVGGIEGIGVVARKGVGVPGLREGQQVIAPLRTGSWCEAFVAEGSVSRLITTRLSRSWIERLQSCSAICEAGSNRSPDAGYRYGP